MALLLYSVILQQIECLWFYQVVYCFYFAFTYLSLVLKHYLFHAFSVCSFSGLILLLSGSAFVAGALCYF